jgi:tetratricopeptide (TPR) repeat protein
MPLDPYVSCPCGSGKKFKWCCAPFYAQIEKAFDLDRTGQHEAALHAIQQLTQSHADQPAVWGYYAQFLYNLGKAEEAENALVEALKLNPNFGMAHFLRGQFRENEGEQIGALLLYRKAAEAYDHEAHDSLAHVYLKIYQLEETLNRPVAARAALERAAHFLPGDAEVRQQLEGEFGDEGALPAAARKAYRLRPTAKPIALDSATGKFSEARKAYEDLTRLTPDDPAAWFDLGLVLAWTGEQPKAVEALNRSIELETDDHRAEEAGALVEVLRCGHGMENDTDYVSHAFIIPIRQPEPIMGLLRAWEQGRRLRGVRANQETGVMTALIVEELPSLLAVGSATLARVTAKMIIAGGAIRLFHPDRDSVAKVADEIRTALQLAVEQPIEQTTPIAFGDVVLEALAHPTQTSDVGAAESKLKEHSRHYFEDVWIHRPLRSLSGVPPIDAPGSKTLRKKLFGVVKFLEDCFDSVRPHKQIGEQFVPVDSYDLGDLRHKLGLEYVSAPPPDVKVPPDAPASREHERPERTASPPVAHAPGSPKKRDISALNAAELAGLDVAALSVEELEQAMRAALKLDARELAVAFARAGLGKPFDPAKPDRYPLYATAITGSVAEGEPAKAVELAEQGEKYDAEHNAGNRAVEFALKKAQLFVKMKDADRAAAAFDGLIATHPDEGKFYTTAAEEMLRMKKPAKALAFAERGVETARRTNNRDLEGHSQELVAAAKRAT